MSEKGSRGSEGGFMGYQENAPDYESSLTPMGWSASWIVRAGHRLVQWYHQNCGPLKY